MAEYKTYQLRGWHALVAIVAVLVFFGIKTQLRVRSVDDGMRDAVRLEVLKEYSGQGPKDVARLVAEARAGSPVEPIPPLVERKVDFTSIEAHGKMGAWATLVRAEITVDGGPPPDGRTVRYFQMTRDLDGHWMVIGQSRAYFYYMELLR